MSKPTVATWAIGWLFLIAAILLAQSCVNRIQEDRFKPAQPSAALKALARKPAEDQTND